MSMRNFAQEPEQADLTPIALNSNATGRTRALGVHESYIFELLTAAGVALTVAEMKAACEFLHITVGGDTKRYLTVEDHLNLELYFGGTNVEGQLVIPTYRQDLIKDDEEWLNMWGTAAEPSIDHKIKIISLAKIAQIKHRARVYPQPTDVRADQRVIGNHNKIITKEMPVPASGILMIQDLMGQIPSETIVRIHITDGGDGVFGDASFETSTNKMLANMSPNRLKQIAYACGRVPQAGYNHIELDGKNTLFRMASMTGLRDLNLVQNFTTVPTSGKVRVIFETMHGISTVNPEDAVAKA